MNKKYFLISCFLLISVISRAQTNSFDKLNFLIGNWTGSGSGFGNEKSTVTASFKFVMGKKYIETKTESKFEPSENNPKGEHHIDKGFISYDNDRKSIIYRQFNNEGFINQYVLNTSKSNDSTIVFETEFIENFVPEGKARWTIKKNSENKIETYFDVYFPNKGYSCFGTNHLVKD